MRGIDYMKLEKRFLAHNYAVKTDFSIVVPIHGDEHLLPYTLPRALALGPDELVPVYDRGDDGVYFLRRLCERLGWSVSKNRLNPVYVDRDPEYRFHVAHARREGFRAARNDIILNIDADLLMDLRIRAYIDEFQGGLTSFGVVNYPKPFQDYIRDLTGFFRRRLQRDWTMTYLFSKSDWLASEDLEDVKTLIAGEDTHIKEALKTAYPDKYRYIETDTVHLRPKEDYKRHYLIGYIEWTRHKASLLKQLGYSMLMFKPGQLVGYCQARYGGVKLRR